MATVGRPRTYSSPEEMQEAIDEYFTLNWTDDKPPTVTGLALHLGFGSKQSLYDYKDRNDGFSYPVRHALTMCESWIEIKAIMGKIPPSIAQFILKNHGWSDKQEVEHSGGTTDTVINVIGVKAKD